MSLFARMMQTIRLTCIGLFCVVSLLSCHGCDDDDDDDKYPLPPSTLITVDVTLSGLQQVPPVSSTETAEASLSLETTDGVLTGSISSSSSSFTAAHIYQAYAGDNGEPVITLEQSASDASQWLVPDGTVLSSEAMEAFQQGQYYLNLLSDSHTKGELRGQIITKNVQLIFSLLTGAEQIPLVVTTAKARSALTFDNDTRAINFHMTSVAVDDAFEGFINKAFAGVNGETMLALEQDKDDEAHWFVSDVLTQTQSSWLQSGELYASLNTASHTSGEIRAQLLPEQISVYWAKLSGSKVVPPVTTSASGRAALTINDKSRAVVVEALTRDLNDASASHIHEAPVGVSGENALVLALARDTATSEQWSGVGTLTAAQYEALKARGLYLDVHSVSNFRGELRGQLLKVIEP